MRYVVLGESADAPWTGHFKGENSVAVGAMEGDELAAYAVYSAAAYDTEYIWLEYVYTLDNYREKYVASDLIEHMERIWRKSGYKYILARIVEENALDSAAYRLMNSTYFTPLQEDNKIFVYRYHDMKSNERIEKLIKVGHTDFGVVHIGSRRNYEYKDFCKELKNNGTDIENVSFDINLSCFSRGSDKKINGCMLMERSTAGVIVKYVYVSKNAGKYALIYMVYDMLVSLKEYTDNESISIILNGKKYIDFFMYFFPDYYKSYDMWDYIMKL